MLVIMVRLIVIFQLNYSTWSKKEMRKNIIIGVQQMFRHPPGGGLALVTQIQGSQAGRPWDATVNASLSYTGGAEPSSKTPFIMFDIRGIAVGKNVQVKWISGLSNLGNKSDGGAPPYATIPQLQADGAAGQWCTDRPIKIVRQRLALIGCFCTYVGPSGNGDTIVDNSNVVGIPFSVGVDSGILVKPAGATGLRLGFSDLLNPSFSYTDHPFVMGLYA